MNWVETTVGEYCPFIYGKGLPKTKRIVGKIPVYGSNGCVDYHSESHVKGPGIIIGRKGSVGAVHLSEVEFWPIDTSFYLEKESIEELKFTYYLLKSLGLEGMNSDSAVPGLNRENAHALTIKIPELKEDREKLGEWISVYDNKIELNRQTNQTLEQIAQTLFKSWFVDFEPVKAKAQVRASVAQDKLPGSDQNTPLPKNFDVEAAVERAAMCAISGKSLEELEQLSLETQQQLKTTAALFPGALVESELGEVPEGWEVKEIKQLASKISKGTTPRKADMQKAEDGETIPFLKVRDISDNGEIKRVGLDKVPETIHVGMLKRSMLENKDILFSIAGTIGRVALVEEDLSNSNCNQAVAFIRLEEPDKYLELCRLNLVGSRVQNEVISKVVQGVQANFSFTSLGEIKVLTPSEELLVRLNKNLRGIAKRQRLLLGENRKLKELRDALLPKLLSGELEIKQTLKEAS